MDCSSLELLNELDEAHSTGNQVILGGFRYGELPLVQD